MRERAINLMQAYFQEPRYIDHALAVTSFAEQIAAGEKVRDPFALQVITLAAIFHDVGIPAALEKHGSGAGPLQEAEGEPIARGLLEQLGVHPDVRERVCYMVGRHHSPEFIDGLDFQILYEADALVNIPTRYRYGQLQDPDEMEAVVAETFRTVTGKDLIRQWIESL